MNNTTNELASANHLLIFFPAIIINEEKTKGNINSKIVSICITSDCKLKNRIYK